MLIPKTSREIWLNRIRVALPIVFLAVAVIVQRPVWNLWGMPLIVLGESLRTWAAGHLVKDEELTIGGPYAHLRNPLYLGSLITTVGFLIIVGDWRLAAGFGAVALGIYIPTVRQEENYLARMHGDAYDTYRRSVPSLVPRLRPARLEIPGTRRERFQWRWVFANGEHGTWFALAMVFAILILRSVVFG